MIKLVGLIRLSPNLIYCRNIFEKSRPPFGSKIFFKVTVQLRILTTTDIRSLSPLPTQPARNSTVGYRLMRIWQPESTAQQTPTLIHICILSNKSFPQYHYFSLDAHRNSIERVLADNEILSGFNLNCFKVIVFKQRLTFPYFIIYKSFSCHLIKYSDERVIKIKLT